MKIYINGKDGSGWAIDMMRDDLINALKRLNIPMTKNFFKAEIVHNIWWNKILDLKYAYLRFKKNIILTAVNYIDLEDENYFMNDKFHKANSLARAWITPSSKQKSILEKYHNTVFHIPYYLNFDLFNYSNYYPNKTAILKKFNIPTELVKDKIIISSFQRDSMGADLNKPKWQKGPDILIELLKDLPKDKFVLLLASSRRHYVINECKKYNINYFYIGKESQEDDVSYNNLPLFKMPELYLISDLYLVSSKSEGGPKAILEAAAMKTFIMSTDVGLASDFLSPDYVFSNIDDYKKKVHFFVENFVGSDKERTQVTEDLYNKCLKLLSWDKLDSDLLKVYNKILNS